MDSNWKSRGKAGRGNNQNYASDSGIDFGTTRVPAASNSANLRLFETFDSSFGFYVHDFLAKPINGLQSTSNLSDFKLKCIKAFVGY